MQHTIYEDPITHRFAVLSLPARFVDGDKVPVRSVTRWFGTQEEALATLSDLFNQDEDVHVED